MKEQSIQGLSDQYLEILGSLLPPRHGVIVIVYNQDEQQIRISTAAQGPKELSAIAVEAVAAAYSQNEPDYSTFLGELHVVKGRA